MKGQYLIITMLLWLAAPLVAQQSDNVNWSNTFTDTRKFVENKGQFNTWNGQANGPILYALDYDGEHVYFTETGVTYRLFNKYRNPNRKKGEIGKPKYLYKTDYIHFNWEGANPNVVLQGQDQRSDYNTYSMVKEDRSGYYNITNVKGFNKVVYKDLYPGIDVTYTIHPEGGIEYEITLHPGADPSQIKMCYDDGQELQLDADGNLIVKTIHGDITETKPVTFYQGNENNQITSDFTLDGTVVSFDLANYDNSQTVVIDPWVQTPSLGNSSCVWECEVDGNGNVYTIGGELPMRLQKWNSAGALQWTYSTPWDTANSWLGTLATDDAGNSYVTSGSVAEIQKVNTGGTMVWSNGPGLFSQDEYWSIAFNCDQTKLIVGGTAFGGGLLVGKIFDINTTTGAVTNSIEINTGYTSLTVLVDEVRSMTSSRNAKYYFLTLDGIGAINQDLAICDNEPLFIRRSNYAFSYKSEAFRPSNGNSGIEAIIANDQFVYTQNGVNVQKRSLLDGSVLGTAPIPGGLNTTTIGLNQPGNSGITVDDCGNVYVGSGDRVIKYDGNLNQLTSTNVSFKVYDVEVSTNGEVIVTGGTGTSNLNTYPRTGYVQAINMNACAPFALICCNPTICPAGPLCDTDAPIMIEAAQTGGTFTGTGITNASNGTFDPAVAGPGTHTIVHTLSCGSDTIEIVVNACANLEVCEEANGDFTVTGGTGPYTWETGVPGVDCSGCPFGTCIPAPPPLGCPGVPDTTWTVIGTGPTVTPTGQRPLRVRDSGINATVIDSGEVVPPCTLCPNITTTIDAQSDAQCFGASDGSASLSSSGGTGPYTYNWMPGNLSGATQNSLMAQTYTVIATDANNCRDTIMVTIGEPTQVTTSISNTPSSCATNDGTATVAASNGTPGYTYIWDDSQNQTTATATGLAPGTYNVTVTDANSCSVIANTTVGTTNGPTLNSITATDETCQGDSTGTAAAVALGGTPPLSYLWSNGETSPTIDSLGAGTYTVTISDANNCTVTGSATVNAGPVCCTMNFTATTVNPTCGTNDGSIDLTVSAGSGNYTFAWSNAAVTEDLSNVGAGSYTVSVTDNGQGCTLDTTINLSSSTGPVVDTIIPTPETCQGDNDGTATVTASGGTGALSYSWSNGDTTQSISGLAPGSYSVNVTDADGCVASGSTIIAAGPVCCLLDFTLQIDDITCTQATGTITVTVDTNSGTPPFEYSFDGGTTFGSSNSQSGLTAGTYTVMVRDADQCATTQMADITSTSTVQVDLGADAFLCNGQSQVLDAGNPGLSYLWSTGETTQTITVDATGNYSVTVTDTSGCSGNDNIDIGAATVAVDAGLDTTITRPNSVPLMAVASGDVTTGTYVWTPSTYLSCDDCQGPVVTSPFDSLTYQVTYTDANGCSATDEVFIGVLPGEYYWIVPNAFTPNGDGQNDVIFPYHEGVRSFTWRIFNRWGEKVLECSDGTCAWDGTFKGKAQNPAVFVWEAVVEFEEPSFQRYHGSLVLIR